MSQPNQPTMTPMTPADAARIKSANAKAGGGQTEKGSFPARAESAAARNASGQPNAPKK